MNAEDRKIMKILRSIIEKYAEDTVKAGASADEIIGLDLAFPFYEQNTFFTAGMVRRDKETGRLFYCIQGYDGSIHPDWTLLTPTLWVPYHGKDRDHAYLFVHPTCAADLYKTGEWMTYTDGHVYKAKNDTNFSPEEYPEAWEMVE